MTVSRPSSRIDARIPPVEFAGNKDLDATHKINPHELRADLNDKAKLLKALESKGIMIDQIATLKQQIATALADLDYIIKNGEPAKENAI